MPTHDTAQAREGYRHHARLPLADARPARLTGTAAVAARYDPKRGSWYFVIDLPRGSDGKRRQMFRRGFRTVKQALREEQLARVQYGRTDLAADGTVAAELTQWLDEREIDIAPTTLGNYRNAITKYVIPRLGTRPIYDLNKRVINDLYRHLLKQGGRNGTPLAAETVRHVHRTLMKALKDLGVSIDGVRQPRPADRDTRGRKGVWTAAQCTRFLTEVATDRLYAAWVPVVVCGLRRGELAGLKRPKVDLDQGVIFVHWQRAVASGEVNGGVVQKEPKRKSKRSIAIGPAVVGVLREHLERQDKEIVEAEGAYRQRGYVFCKENGEPYHPKYFTDRFRALCFKAGVPVIVLHDGRHTSATVGAHRRPPARGWPGRTRTGPTTASPSTGSGTPAATSHKSSTPTCSPTPNAARPRSWRRLSSASPVAGG